MNKGSHIAARDAREINIWGVDVVTKVAADEGGGRVAVDSGKSNAG